MDQTGLVELKQCHKCADVLFDNFRNDIACQALERFKAHGVCICELLELQEKIGCLVYPWDSMYDRLRYNVNRRFVFFPLIIAMCQTTKQVKQIFHWAQKKRFPVTLRGGSHCFET